MEVNIESLFPAIRNTGLEAPSGNLLGTTYIGIDFGTSTTVVSIARFDTSTNKIVTEPIWLNQKLYDGTILRSDKIPTVLAWYNDEILVGKGAADMKFDLRLGENVWYSFKMELGEDKGIKYYRSPLDGNGTYKILNPIDAAKVFFQYLNAQIKRYVKENNLPENIKYAVSIPASFEANQRKELITALEHNGMSLASQSLIDEPNAAFLSYVQNASAEGKAIKIPENHYPNLLVFDFGAGTCDISILELGKNLNGVYSKNLSISRFEKLGGDNIDKLLAIDYLYPALLEENGLQSEDFKTPEKKRILSRLLKSAEELKIEICQDIALRMHERTLPEKASSEEFISLGGKVTVDTNNFGELTLTRPRISYAQFHEMMQKFLNPENARVNKSKEFEEEFPSIFSPIRTALDKAELDADEIDYVLFIGGSSKNPYVQTYLSNYFKDSVLLIPRDLQTHVSEGAAIHSLIFNGFNKNIIQPITSEPLIVITSDERPKIILRAGTEIPCDLIVIDDLVTSYEGQKSIELPICLGNQNRILYNIIIHSQNPNGFPKDTPVKLELEITADKLLIVRATSSGQQVMVEPINPFANKDMDTNQRIIFHAEKTANIDAQKNNGKPSFGALNQLAEAYEKAGNSLRAGETLELCYEIYQNKSNLNNIAVYYANSGNKKKALEYYQKAYEEVGSPIIIMNYASHIRFADKKKYRELINEALIKDPNYVRALINLGELYKEENNPEWKPLVQKAFDNLYSRFKLNVNELDQNEYYWLKTSARMLGENQVYNEVLSQQPRNENDELYNSENLTRINSSKRLN